MVVSKYVYVGVFELPGNTKRMYTGITDGRFVIQFVTEQTPTGDVFYEEYFNNIPDAVKKYPFFDEKGQWFEVEF